MTRKQQPKCNVTVPTAAANTKAVVATSKVVTLNVPKVTASKPATTTSTTSVKTVKSAPAGKHTDIKTPNKTYIKNRRSS